MCRVQRVVINAPASDLRIDNTRVARNTGYVVENGGTDGSSLLPPSSGGWLRYTEGEQPDCHRSPSRFARCGRRLPAGGFTAVSGVGVVG